MLKLIQLVVQQPKDYSEMLTKIAVFTFFSSLGATFLLDRFSPPVSAFLNAWEITVDVWIIEKLPITWMLLPLLFTLVARVIKLHDRISDLFKIRETFDLDEILLPLARGAGVRPTAALRTHLKAKRDAQMSRNFYVYAGFKEPAIDRQLVLSALDNWCWYWVILELTTVGLLAAAILAFSATGVAFGLAGGMLLLVLLSRLVRRHSRHLAAAEVEAILTAPDRRTQIKDNLDALQAERPDDKG